jgi:hypothetical protein
MSSQSGCQRRTSRSGRRPLSTARLKPSWTAHSRTVLSCLGSNWAPTVPRRQRRPKPPEQEGDRRGADHEHRQPKVPVLASTSINRPTPAPATRRRRPRTASVPTSPQNRTSSVIPSVVKPLPMSSANKPSNGSSNHVQRGVRRQHQQEAVGRLPSWRRRPTAPPCGTPRVTTRTLATTPFAPDRHVGNFVGFACPSDTMRDLAGRAWAYPDRHPVGIVLAGNRYDATRRRESVQELSGNVPASARSSVERAADF